jgi:hypothetical protein
MPSDVIPSTENQPAPLSGSSTLARLAGIGVVILWVVGGFLYLGGWFNPDERIPARFVNGFVKVYGIRCNHAKRHMRQRFFREQWQGNAPLEGRFVLDRPRAGHRPLLARRWQSLYWRYSRRDPWPRTSLSVARWPRVADRDDQSSDISVQHPAGLLRQLDCFATRPQHG